MYPWKDCTSNKCTVYKFFDDHRRVGRLCCDPISFVMHSLASPARHGLNYSWAKIYVIYIWHSYIKPPSE